MDSKTVEAKQAESKTNKGTDPEEREIEKNRIDLKIPKPEDFSSGSKRQALYRLNMKNATKDDTPEKMHERQAAEGKAHPFVFKKGGRVKKGGMALVHTGEKVLTKAQAKKDSRGKMVSCKK
jgi:hypothetical protein